MSIRCTLAMWASSATSLSDVRYDCFWFSTLWIFLRFYVVVSRVHPSKERYWKKSSRNTSA